MKQISKVVLSLGIVTSLLTISQVSFAETSAPVFGLKDSHGSQTITFEDSANRACAKKTPRPVVFFYTKNSAGKNMKLDDSKEFIEIIQESRTFIKNYDFTYKDNLIPRKKNIKPVRLIGTVKSEGNDKMTNSGEWETQMGKFICSGRFTIAPTGL